MTKLERYFVFFALAVIILGTAFVLIQYQPNKDQPQLAAAESPAAPNQKTAKNNPIVERYRACLRTAERNHEVSWEINCESVVEGAAQRYNTCVSKLAAARKLTNPPKACEANCILPSSIATGLVRERDEAKSRCMKDMKASIEH